MRIRVFRIPEVIIGGPPWCRECPHCGPTTRYSFWFDWSAAVRNAQRHALIHRFDQTDNRPKLRVVK